MSQFTPARDPVAHLYSEHHSWLEQWLCRKLECSAHAADLAQDTFVRIIQFQRKQNERDLVKELQEPRAYLTTVAKRLLLNHYRRLSLEQSYMAALAALPEQEAPSPQQQLIIQQTLQELDQLLSTLPVAVRQTFLLSQLRGLTYDEIAEQMDISTRTVKRYMARAFEECIVLMM